MEDNLASEQGGISIRENDKRKVVMADGMNLIDGVDLVDGIDLDLMLIISSQISDPTSPTCLPFCLLQQSLPQHQRLLPMTSDLCRHIQHSPLIMKPQNDLNSSLDITTHTSSNLHQSLKPEILTSSLPKHSQIL